MWNIVLHRTTECLEAGRVSVPPPPCRRGQCHRSSSCVVGYLPDQLRRYNMNMTAYLGTLLALLSWGIHGSSLSRRRERGGFVWRAELTNGGTCRRLEIDCVLYILAHKPRIRGILIKRCDGTGSRIGTLGIQPRSSPPTMTRRYPDRSRSLSSSANTRPSHQ